MTEDDPMQQEGAEEAEPTTLVTLNYLDKLYDSQVKSQSVAAKTALLMQVITVVLLALSFGVVSAGDTFSLLGLELQIPLTMFLFGGGTILAVLFVAWYALHRWGNGARKEIRRVYRSIGAETVVGYEVHTFVDAFDSPDPYTALGELVFTARKKHTNSSFANFFDTVAGGLTVVALLILPIIAEGVVVWNLVATDWLWALSLPLVLIPLGALAAAIAESWQS